MACRSGMRYRPLCNSTGRGNRMEVTHAFDGGRRQPRGEPRTSRGRECQQALALING